jgi:hypothetical protein
VVDVDLIQRLALIGAALDVPFDDIEALAALNSQATIRGLLDALNANLVAEWGLRQYLRAFSLGELQSAGAPESLVADREAQDRAVKAGHQPAVMQRKKHPTLEELLVRPREESDGLILQGVQRYAGEVSGLSPAGLLELRNRLREWWPTEGFSSAITRTSPQTWTITWGASAWLWLAPPADMDVDQNQWVEIATSGVVLEDHAKWLRRHWEPSFADLIVDSFDSSSADDWSRLVICIPDPLPLPIAKKLISCVNEKVNDHELLTIGEKVAEAAGTEGLRQLAEKSGELKRVLARLLAERGDVPAIRRLLTELEGRLKDGELPMSLDLPWLDGPMDVSLLDPLFRCLRFAYKRQMAGRRFSDTTSPLLQAISRIGGEDAIVGFDRILAEEPDCQFLRHDRDAIAQSELRQEAAASLDTALEYLDLPLLQEQDAPA